MQKHFRLRNALFAGLLLAAFGCSSHTHPTTDFNVDSAIAYCSCQAIKTLETLPDVDSIPNTIDKGQKKWQYAHVGSWTSGFWPGTLWYLYEATQDTVWLHAAENVTRILLPEAYRKARSHDSGFIMMPSVGNAYRLTGDTMYAQALHHAADSLAELYNPKVGTILSWPGMVKKMNWPHNTIIDNMMNLELLFWSAKNGGNKWLYDVAVKHAETTMKYHFRTDHSCYHVAVYDTLDGHFIKGVTHQGLADSTMWARGQAWAIYGYTMVYRETRDVRFLEVACQSADAYLRRLPEDMVPYWDFDAPMSPLLPPKDASAAAVTASALIELSGYVNDEIKSRHYLDVAIAMLENLSSSAYQSGTVNTAFLLHSVGHMPRGREIDASIMYADYYYIEALLRLRTVNKGG
jgi:unsaturated chondroitin disaccharide hydrolase